MAQALTAEQQKQFDKIKAANQRFFNFGVGQLIFTILLSLFVWANQGPIDNFMGDGGPWGRPALEQLKTIQPETPREAYLLSVFREMIPLPIVAVKTSFIYSTLMWLFLTSFIVIGVSWSHRKHLDFFRSVLDQPKNN